MNEAARLAREGASGGLVVIADSQSAGRGRHGRQWVSVPGQDLLLSIALRPRPSVAAQLLMLASLAAARATHDVGGVEATLKWPNDVRYGGRKLCGVLAESYQVGGDLIVVVGIGLNVNLDSVAARSSGIDATSLAEIVGRTVSRLETFKSLLGHCDRLYRELDSGESLVPEWSSKLETIGTDVTVVFRADARASQAIHGRAEGVDEAGRLLVRDVHGDLWPVSAGEVTLQASR